MLALEPLNMFSGSVASTLQGYGQLGKATETEKGSLEMLLSGAKSGGEKAAGQDTASFENC